MLTTIRRFLGKWVVPPAYTRILGKGIQIRSKRAPKWVEILDGPLRGRQMLLNLDSPGFWQRVLREGSFDSFIYEEMYKWGDLLGRTVWDVGAHMGYHTLAMACLVGSSGHVVAFEPNPHNLERLRTNLDRNPDLAQRVIIVDSALSQDDGEMRFVQSSDVDGGRSSGSHLADALLPMVESVYESFTETLVRCVKADTLLASKAVPLPQVMKVDVEGAEHLVLNGAQQLLSNCRPILFVEVHNVTAMFHVQKLLLGLGYSVEILDAQHSSPSRCFILAKPANEAG